MKKVLAIWAMLLMVGIGTARAQDQQTAPPDDQSQATANDSDQGGPDVGRLSYIHGKVSTQRGDNGEWVGVTLNTPVMPGDRISTGDDSKAELQLDWANIIRLSSNATIKVANLTRNSIQVQVGQGLVTYSVLGGGEATAEIDTPNTAVHPSGQGEYRIFVSGDQSIVVARESGADVSTPQGSAHVDPGQMITVEGTDNPQYKIDPAPARDDWDAWNSDRDHVISKAEQSTNANRYEVGTQDLDAYGHWENVPDYGQVWVPNEGSDWVPYRDGRWVWEPYYGWTWVSYEPWGWAPYHYGRWFVYNDAWVWWPGPVYVGYYPIWAPAYVSFFGWGGWGFGFGFGFGWGWGHVGWLPCGPGDWYHPWWGRWGRGYRDYDFDHINRFHEGFAPLGPRNTLHQYSNFDRVMRDSRVRAGFSSMDGRNFGRAAVPTHQGLIPTSTLHTMTMRTGKLGISPNHESYSATGRAADPASYRHAPSSTQHFFAAPRTGTNAVAARGNFNSGSRVGTISRHLNTSRPASTANRAFERPSSTTNAPRTNTMTNTNRGSAPITSARPGWHTFAPPSSASTNRGTTAPNGMRGGSTFERPSSTMTPRTNTMTNTNRGSAPITSARPGWHAFTPPTSTSRAYSNNSRGYTYSRPSLNMRQPIVTPRNNGYGSYGSRGYGSYGSPSYNTPRPTYNPPRSYSAPRSTTAPRSYSAPRGGGSLGGGHTGGGGGHPSGGGSHGHH
jgi:hypothetical protein